MKRYYCNITVLMDAGPKDDPEKLIEKLIEEAGLDFEDAIEITEIRNGVPVGKES